MLYVACNIQKSNKQAQEIRLKAYVDAINKIKIIFLAYFFIFNYNLSKKGVIYMAQAQTVNVNFKLDPEVKKNMEQVCSDMGLSMSAAFTIFAKKVCRERRIPFEISADPFYSEENMAVLERRIADAKAGRNMHEHELIEVD